MSLDRRTVLSLMGGALLAPLMPNSFATHPSAMLFKPKRVGFPFNAVTFSTVRSPADGLSYVRALMPWAHPNESGGENWGFYGIAAIKDDDVPTARKRALESLLRVFKEKVEGEIA